MHDLRRIVGRLRVRWQLSRLKSWTIAKWRRNQDGQASGVAYWDDGEVCGWFHARLRGQGGCLLHLSSEEESVHTFEVPCAGDETHSNEKHWDSTSRIEFRYSPPTAVQRYLCRSPEVSVHSLHGIIATGIAVDGVERLPPCRSLPGEVLSKVGALNAGNSVEDAFETKSRKPWMKRTLDLYVRANQVFEAEFGKSLHCVGGTLLGAIRDGGFISFDKDLDVAYVSEHSVPEIVKDEFVEIILRLLELGENVVIRDRRGRLQPRHAKWWDKGGRYIDLFPAYFDDAGYYSRPTFVRVPIFRDDVLPLAPVAFDGAEVFVPRRSIKKIELIFGEEWLTPDKGWKKPAFRGASEMRRRIRFRKGDIRRIAARSSVDERAALLAIIGEK